MVLNDNTSYFSSEDNIGEFLSLQNIANRNIAELLDEHGQSILTYPYSFGLCRDKCGSQFLLSLKSSWNGSKCSKVQLDTQNIAGFISCNGKSVSINSRFSRNGDEDFFMHYMLKRVFHINVVSLEHMTTHDKVFDFMLYLFPTFLNNALSQGLYKEYMRNEYNDDNVRGVIDIGRHIRRNVPFKGCIAYSTREFSHDNHMTELIRHTIEYIRKIRIGNALLETDEETRVNVSRIIASTRSYDRSEREKVMQENIKALNHPYFTHYIPLQNLCLRILKHEKLKYGYEKRPVYGILFDVSYLWEEYLAGILIQQGFKHSDNRKQKGRISLAKGNKFPRYPDYFREGDSVVIDAKYKSDTGQRNDVHQLITYMYRLKARRGIFIYPTAEDHSIETYELNGYGDDDHAILQIYMYHIPQVAVNYTDFVSQMTESERQLSQDMSVHSIF